MPCLHLSNPFDFQKKKQVKNPLAISGYDCAKNKAGMLDCWSTEGPCLQCNEKV